MALKMKDDNPSDDKSSLQASVLVFSLHFQPNHTEQSSVELSQFQSAGWPFNKDWSWFELCGQYVIDFDIDFKSHQKSLP